MNIEPAFSRTDAPFNSATALGTSSCLSHRGNGPRKITLWVLSTTDSVAIDTQTTINEHRTQHQGINLSGIK
jgi:hypothetical protein